MFGIRSVSEMPEITLEADKVLEILGIPITNSMIGSWLTMVFLIIIAIVASRRFSLVPTGLQSAVETVLEVFYRRVVEARVGDQASLFFPFVATIFFFILLSNWLGALLPGIGSVGFLQPRDGEAVFVPLLRSANTDLNTTLALALFSVLGVQLYGVKQQGFFGYARRFIRLDGFKYVFRSLVGLQPRQGLLRTLMNAVIDAFIGLLEVFDELVKLLSFSFRLFGNIFAGEVLLIVTAMLLFQIFGRLAVIPFSVSLLFVILEIFVGFIQAFVFATLTLVFLRLATAHR